jgi:hypothetical protein
MVISESVWIALIGGGVAIIGTVGGIIIALLNKIHLNTNSNFAEQRKEIQELQGQIKLLLVEKMDIETAKAVLKQAAEAAAEVLKIEATIAKGRLDQ